MNKKILSFSILTILLISFLSASSVGISPTTIKFSQKPNEIICKNFSIFDEGNSLFLGELKWSRENSKNINQYTLSSDELKIESTFQDKIKAGKYQICVSAKNSGNYFGTLTYKIENSSYAIGAWIQLNITNNNHFSKILSITGSSIKELDYKKIFFLTPILFFAILVFLLFKLKKNKTELNKNI